MKPHLKPHISSSVIFFTEKRAAQAEVDKSAVRDCLWNPKTWLVMNKYSLWNSEERAVNKFRAAFLSTSACAARFSVKKDDGGRDVWFEVWLHTRPIYAKPVKTSH